MQSIFAQTYANIEYIIVDGGSTDGTLDIIKGAEAQVDYWVSERDKGLYDAMNKGMQLAKGDYLLFMNAGDKLFAPDTLENVFSDNTEADVYYGDAMYIDEGRAEIGLRSKLTTHALPQQLSWKSLRFGMVVCHQSFIVRRDIAPPYVLDHLYSADIDWMIKCLKISDRIVHTQLVISHYLVGGFSVQNHRKSLLDRFDILSKHFGVVPTLFAHLYIILRAVAHKLRP